MSPAKGNKTWAFGFRRQMLYQCKFIVEWEHTFMGNCEEELPKKPVGRQLTNSLPTANQQVTDRLRKKKNCVKNEQLT